MPTFKRGQPIRYPQVAISNDALSWVGPGGPASSVAIGGASIVPEGSIAIGARIEPGIGLTGTANVIIGHDIDYSGGNVTLVGCSTVGNGAYAVALGHGAIAGAGQCVLGGPGVTQWVLGQPGAVTLPVAADNALAAAEGVPIGGLYQGGGNPSPLYIRTA